MQDPLVPYERLASAKKILFIAHLAIGDYQYLQSFFKEFSRQWPHITMHIWVDEVRRTRCFWRWRYLKKYSLYDWLADNSPFSYVYAQTYSPALYKQSIRKARLENYDIVVSIATLRAYRYATLARSIAGKKGFAVGIKQPTRWWQWIKNYRYYALDAKLSMHEINKKQITHITDMYALWFEQMFGMQTTVAQRAPYMHIPKKWLIATSLLLLKWGINRRSTFPQMLIFINAFAKDQRRCWPLENVFTLIRTLHTTGLFDHAHFIINTTPESYEQSLRVYREHGAKRTYLFSARDSFFQLPAMISLCDRIISVETAVMHIAAALNKPIIALMRKKNPEWAPWDTGKNTIIQTKLRTDWVKNISVEDVLHCLLDNHQ